VSLAALALIAVCYLSKYEQKF